MRNLSNLLVAVGGFALAASLLVDVLWSSGLGRAPKGEDLEAWKAEAEKSHRDYIRKDETLREQVRRELREKAPPP